MLRVCTYNPEKARKIKEIDIFILLIILAISIWGIVEYNFLNEGIAQEIQEYGLIALFFFTALLEFIPQIMHPFAGVILATGVGVSLTSATFIASIASVCGSILGFEVGKKYGFGFVCPLFKEKVLRKTLALWDKYGREFVLVSAITPLPFLPLIFGALGLKRKYMIIYGIVPRVIGYVILAWMYYYGLRLV